MTATKKIPAYPFPLLIVKDRLVKKAPTIFQEALRKKSISTEQIAELIAPKFRSGKKFDNALSLLINVFIGQGIFVTYTQLISRESFFTQMQQRIDRSIVPKIVKEDKWQIEAKRLISFYKDVKKLFLSKKDKQVFFYYYGFNKHFRRYSQKEVCSVYKLKGPTDLIQIINSVWKSMSPKYKTISPSNVSTVIKEVCTFARKNNKYIDWEVLELKPLL